MCAYKGGQVVVDAAAGYLGEYDPRPVQPDSLFPVFSATKGVTAGLLHWLALEKGSVLLSPTASGALVCTHKGGLSLPLLLP